MARCSLCNGLAVVPKTWWSDYFATKTCPLCGGSGQALVPPPEIPPPKPVTPAPKQEGDFVAGVEFMLDAFCGGK